MLTAYIALGSNLGEREALIDAALASLNDPPAVTVVRRSSLLANASVGGPADAPEFLNAVAELTVNIGPHDLLQRMLAVEANLGRVRGGDQNAPRLIDLDLLLYGDLHIDSPDLHVPHLKMESREFVMKPLRELIG